MLFELTFSFADTFYYLEQVGVMNYVLPFLLVFAIVFAILEKTAILGENKKNINVVVSFVIGMLLVVQQGIVELINLFLPRVSLILVVMLMTLMLIAMLAGKKFEGIKGPVFSIGIILVIVAIIFALTSPPATSGFFLSEADKAALIRIGIPLLIFFIAVGIVTSGGERPNKESNMETLAKAFGRGKDS
ncbi:hypothetical protein J4476_00175 [Candidatus Woesearchaeota archaeon]|nr:MAG: hypothetical protein QT09_C0010G0007 [archaeon GW2011_AR18]MBS3161100.1 hypothetical protein [Candidatus Woesearchaeota archaeon]HIH25508.1 hypothetical protein [Nanoarchaeota archaeon]